MGWCRTCFRDVTNSYDKKSDSVRWIHVSTSQERIDWRQAFTAPAPVLSADEQLRADEKARSEALALEAHLARLAELPAERLTPAERTALAESEQARLHPADGKLAIWTARYEYRGARDAAEAAHYATAQAKGEVPDASVEVIRQYVTPTGRHVVIVKRVRPAAEGEWGSEKYQRDIDADFVARDVAKADAEWASAPEAMARKVIIGRLIDEAHRARHGCTDEADHDAKVREYHATATYESDTYRDDICAEPVDRERSDEDDEREAVEPQVISLSTIIGQLEASIATSQERAARLADVADGSLKVAEHRGEVRAYENALTLLRILSGRCVECGEQPSDGAISNGRCADCGPWAVARGDVAPVLAR